jgi:hypothetical protein
LYPNSLYFSTAIFGANSLIKPVFHRHGTTRLLYYRFLAVFENLAFWLGWVGEDNGNFTLDTNDQQFLEGRPWDG